MATETSTEARSSPGVWALRAALPPCPSTDAPPPQYGSPFSLLRALQPCISELQAVTTKGHKQANGTKVKEGEPHEPNRFAIRCNPIPRLVYNNDHCLSLCSRSICLCPRPPLDNLSGGIPGPASSPPAPRDPPSTDPPRCAHPSRWQRCHACNLIPVSPSSPSPPHRRPTGPHSRADFGNYN